MDLYYFYYILMLFHRKVSFYADDIICNGMHGFRNKKQTYLYKECCQVVEQERLKKVYFVSITTLCYYLEI